MPVNTSEVARSFGMNPLPSEDASLLAAAEEWEDRAKQMDASLVLERRVFFRGSDDDFLEDASRELGRATKLRGQKEQRDRLLDQAIAYRMLLLEQQSNAQRFDAALHNLDAILLNHEAKNRIRLAIFEIVRPRHPSVATIALGTVPDAVLDDLYHRRATFSYASSRNL